jgi:dienelactone hydrolase
VRAGDRHLNFYETRDNLPVPAGRCSSTRACPRPSSDHGPRACRSRCTGWTSTRSSSGEGDIDAARALVAEAEDAELFLYQGDQHYFADSSRPSYDAAATALLTRRVPEFLRER